jgi:hypothetical protein
MKDANAVLCLDPGAEYMSKMGEGKEKNEDGGYAGGPGAPGSLKILLQLPSPPRGITIFPIHFTSADFSHSILY